MDTTRNILLLDADEQSAQDIQRFLKVSAFVFAINHVTDVFEALSYLKSRKPDIALIDSNILREGNFELLKAQLQKENIPIILLGNSNPGDPRRETEKAGAKEYLTKDKINLFHLQKAILNTLKINDTELRLDKSFNKFNEMQEAWRSILDKTGEGILIINSANSILYANTRAYSILGDADLHDKIAGYIFFRQLEEDESLELKPGKNVSVKIKISEVEWYGEKANLFILDKQNISNSQQGSESWQTLVVFLNSMRQGMILVKDNQVVFANKSALKKLNLEQSKIEKLALSEIFEGADDLQAGSSIKNFLAERSTVFGFKQPGGGLKQVKAFIKPVNIGDDFYQMISLEMPEDQTENGIPKERSDAGKFSPAGILEMASHDLREPVRTILNYVQLISENLQKEKYDEATEYAGFAQVAADRMEKLLSDLKVYVSLNDFKFNPVKVSAKQIVNDALKQLKTRIELNGAEINVAELPDVKADRELTEKLFYQLIDNALKFQKKGKKAVIDIGFDKYEGSVLFCVRDNGIGISKKYGDKIFELFERLNRVDEYSGNGLGLALCKKIVDIHGGKIWVESLPGFGSNFYFTLEPR